MQLYIEGYLQAMLDTIYKQEYLRVRVVDNQVNSSCHIISFFFCACDLEFIYFGIISLWIDQYKISEDPRVIPFIPSQFLRKH